MCEIHKFLTPPPSPPTGLAPIGTLHAPYSRLEFDSNGNIREVWDWKTVSIKGLKLRDAFAHVPSSTTTSIRSTGIKHFWQHTSQSFDCNLGTKATFDAHGTYDYTFGWDQLTDCKEEQYRRHLEAAYSYAITEDPINLFDYTHEAIFDQYSTEFMRRNDLIDNIDGVLKSFRDEYMIYANQNAELRHEFDSWLEQRWDLMLGEICISTIAK